MKPLTLTMTAFGPYEKETIIDFRKFDNSLFLITGRTGSGKTTIFDGIMYSLFGEVSGGERKALEMRTKFVDAKTVTRILFEFEHDGEIYSVERTIRSTKKTADATLKCPDKTIEGFTKVNAYIPDLIGITAGQFRGVVMLAQGKFRELLSAKSDERADILRKIFSTDIYKQFQLRLKEKASKANSSYQNEVSSIATVIRGLSCPEEMTELSFFLENPVVTPDSMDKLFYEISSVEKQDRELMSELETEIQKNDSLLKEIDGNLAKATENNKRLDNLQKEKAEYAALLEKESYFTGLEKETKITRNAEKVVPAEKGWKKSLDEVAAFTRTVSEKTEYIAKNTPQIAVLQKNVEDLEKSPEQEEWQKEKGKLELALPQYDELDKTASELLKEETLRKNKQEILDAVILSVSQLTENIQKNEETLKTLDRVELLKLEKVSLQGEMDKKHQIILNTESMLHDLETQKKTVDTAKKDSDAARNLYTSLKNITDDLDTRLWDGQAGVLAEKLKDGEPCPVCGSPVHPHPAVKPAAVPSKAEVDTARKKAETAKLAVDTAAAKTERYSAEYKANTLNLIKYVKENLGDSLEVPEDILSVAPQLSLKKNFLEKQKADLMEDVRDLEEKCKLRNELMKILPEQQEEKKQKESSVEKEKEELQNIDGVIKGLTAKKDTISRGLPYPSRKEAETALRNLDSKIAGYISDLNRARTSLNSLKTGVDQAIGAKKEAEVKLKIAISSEEKEHADYLRVLKEYGFPDEDAYHAALDNLATLEEDERNIAEYRRNIATKKGSVTAMEQETSGLSHIDISGLTREETALRDTLRNLRSRQGTVQHRIQDNAKYLKRIRDAWSASEKMMEEYTALADLSAIANGEVSGNKLDLERYIMAAFFDEVLENANGKLSVMTDGRYQLVRTADSGDGRKTTGLDLAIIDRYSMGISRGTQTLSGGESFMAALSLALGLSDAIQQSAGGISINALFVDEGFDSLDTDTLQEVLKVLQGLTTGNCLVGIISHVESLKEQIEKKIVVTKLGDGKSVVRMEA